MVLLALLTSGALRGYGTVRLLGKKGLNYRGSGAYRENCDCKERGRRQAAGSQLCLTPTAITRAFKRSGRRNRNKASGIRGYHCGEYEDTVVWVVTTAY